jgi:small subunit ribosomal protein S9
MTPTKKTTEEAEAPKAKKPAAKKAAAPKAAKKVVAEEPAMAAEGAVEEETAAPKKVMASGAYIYALGRRKRAIAKTRVWVEGTGVITVNGKPMREYFTVYDLQEEVMNPLVVVGAAESMDVKLEVSGGGMRGQAEAARLGISRALVEFNPNYRKSLKKLGYMMRDPREKERKHYGFKKARKAPQWAKR